MNHNQYPVFMQIISFAYNTQHLQIVDMHMCTIMLILPIIDAYSLFIVNKFSQH